MKTWVLLKRLTELVGYTPNAVYAKIKKGIWRQDVHWIKAPDGHLAFNLEAIYRWIEGKE